MAVIMYILFKIIHIDTLPNSPSAMAFELVTTIPHEFFMLTNFILLFVYCIISIPMYIMSRR
ncbi:MAG TPA: hypothetical protein DHW56_00730 [Dialister sp.]|nr:hypothetical protein [Dialister sp.]